MMDPDERAEFRNRMLRAIEKAWDAHGGVRPIKKISCNPETYQKMVDAYDNHPSNWDAHVEVDEFIPDGQVAIEFE